MRPSFFLLALPAIFHQAFASPTAAKDVNLAAREAAALYRRQEAEASSNVATLLTNIKPYTGAINSTTASLCSASTAADNATAATSITQNLEAITDLVLITANNTILSASSSASKLRVRQTSTNSTALAEEIAELLEEISGSLNGIVDTLGLGPVLAGLNPLVLSLSVLLLSLENVVDNLLVVVKELLDGLLTGLSIGLAGLIL